MTEAPLYTPPLDAVKATKGWRFMEYVQGKTGAKLLAANPSETFTNLHRWSVENLGEFHSLAWDFCKIIGEKGDIALQNPENMLEARFFPHGKISFAENMLHQAQKTPDQPAIIARVAGRETQDRILSWQDLSDQVSLWQRLLEQSGIKEGDRVSTYLPHIPEAYIIMIAAANLGAIFSSVGTEMGAEATADRFRQIKPKLLIAVDGYAHATPRGEKIEDRLPTVAELQRQLEGALETTILIPNLGKAPDLSALSGKTLLAPELLSKLKPAALTFPRRAFDHPLAILFSSGSTGAPKCFVHGTGNLLLKHAIEHQLHGDTRVGDREFYHSTTSWMMFNWLAGALAQGASILIYDGNPAHPDAAAHLDFCAKYRCTHLGTAAGVVQDVWRGGGVHIDPAKTDLSSLRALSYTASVLSADGYKYLHDHVKADMSINGICGGTDFVGCYAAGNTFMPTCAGQLKGPVLGMAVEIWDETGKPIPAGQAGEIVITAPFISRPLYFWGDQKTPQYPHGERFTTSYFTHFKDVSPPVWRHGDAARMLPSGQMIVEGRSDSTLNQNGVRIGSQVLYDAIENSALKTRVTDSLAANFKDAEGGDHTILFLVPAQPLDETATQELKNAVRALISDKVGRLCVPHEVQCVPYTLKTPNGKRAEKPTKEALAGQTAKTPETYGTDPQTGAYKITLFEDIGQSLRQNPKYGFGEKILLQK